VGQVTESAGALSYLGGWSSQTPTAGEVRMSDLDKDANTELSDADLDSVSGGLPSTFHTQQTEENTNKSKASDIAYATEIAILKG
jgi:hypothetical protein